MEIKVIDNKTIFLKGKKENILVNPKKEILGNSKYSSRILIITGEKFDDLSLKTDGVVIRGPGEYEVGRKQL